MRSYYFVTDIEADGLSPAENSMLSFASVAVREDGSLAGEFEAVLTPRRDRRPSPRTMEWWKTQPEAWRAATADPEPPERVMRRFSAWVEGYDGKRAFAARPLLFDGMWIDHYLREFAGSHIFDMPHAGKPIFTAGALDIDSYLLGVFDRHEPLTADTVFPPEWLGNHEHTHRAIDDARGYAALLGKLLAIAGKQPRHPDDFITPAQANDLTKKCT